MLHLSGFEETITSIALSASTYTLGPSRSNFFFEQCCARHYNRGSHEAVLK